MRSSPHLKRSSPLTRNRIPNSVPKLALELKRTPNSNLKSLFARCVLCPALAPECPICAPSQICTLNAQTCTECAFAACVAQGVAPPASNIPTLSPIGAPTTTTAAIPTIPGGLPLPTKSTMDTSMDMMSTATVSDTAMASMTGMTMTDSVMSMATGIGTGTMMGSGSSGAMTMATGTATGMSGMTTTTVSAMMSSQMMGSGSGSMSGSMSATGSAMATTTAVSTAGAVGMGGLGNGVEGVLALMMVLVGLVVR